MQASAPLRRGVAGLATLASHDLAALWRQVETAAQAEAALRDILPGLIETYGLAAGTLAADWYDDLREHREIRGRFTAIPADIPDVGAQALVGWALAEVKDPADLSAFRALIEGGTQRRIANFSRQTVTQSSVADPQASGWQRVGSGECAFCAMLIGRGAVYTEASADFASHDHCNCGAEPAWSGETKPVKPYTPSSKNITDADRARVRAWIASH